ncbi:uncharacterized protein [Ptychodera flava]|uniref:uncharacterized protein n=1 Tax=Ptychodera flava TaxID=63121 RepID=UPI00396A835E
MTNRGNIRNHYTPGHPASLATTVIYNNHVAAGHGNPSHPVYHHNPFYLYQRLDHNNTQQSYPPVPGSNAYYDVIQRQAFSNGRPQMPYSFPTFANMQSFPRNRGRHVNQHFQRAHESSAVGRGLDNVWQAATSANRLSIRTNGTVQYPPNTSMPHRGIDTGRDATPGFRSREAAATRTESGLHRRERDPSAQSSTPSVEDGDDVPDLVSSSSPSSDESADSLRQFANEEEGAAAAPLTTSPANEARRQEPLATDRQEQLHDNLSPDAQSNSEGLGRERNSGGVRTPPATVDDGPGEATLPDSRDSHVSNVNSQQVPNIGEYQPAYGATLRDPSAQSFFKLDRKTAHKSLEFLEQNKVQRIITPHNHNDVHGNNIPELPFSPTKHQPDRCRLCQYTDMSYSSSAAPLQDPHPMAPAKPEPADRQGQYVGPSCTVLADRAFTQGQHWLIVICQLPDVPLTRDWLFTFGVSSGRGKRDELLTADTCAWCMEVSGVGYRFVRHGNRVISLQESNIPTCHSDAGASQERQPGKLTMGLLLDMDNRSLTFYRIDTRRRLFTFNDVRAQVPLYPAFSIGLEGLTLEVRSVVPVPDYVNLPSQRQRTQQNQRGSGTITPV